MQKWQELAFALGAGADKPYIQKFGSSLLSHGLYPGRAQLMFVRRAGTRCEVFVHGAALYAILAW